MTRLRIGLVLLSIALVATAWQGASAARRTPPERARGLVFTGLTPASAGPCRGMFQLETPGKAALCTHGPDRAPDGIDVTEHRTVADLSADTTSGTTGTGGGGVACIGDGVSGPRVQAIYAVASDRSDRYDSIAPLIAGWAGQMDSALNQSAAETGGERHIRFVTNPDCSLSIAHAVLSPTGDDSINNTITELQNLGHNLGGRKYLIWTDASGVYCGIATVTTDDVSGSANRANSVTGYARVDTACWGGTTHLSELHELFHNLGAVQLSAPHSSGGYHCTDESDVMCYQDSADDVMTFTCPTSHEWL